MSRRKAKPKKRPSTTLGSKARRASLRDAQGRVHLVLQRDPATGAQAVRLKAPIFEHAWQNELAVSAAATAHDALSAGVAQERVVELTRHAMDVTSQLADGLLAQAPSGSVACRPGCDHCCYQSVGVTAAEALTVAAHLQQIWTAEDVAETIRRLAEARSRTAGLSAEDRFSPEHPCPFLKARRCSIYEVRPLACRGMNSLDATECESNLHDPTSRARFRASGVGGRAFMEPIRAFHAVSAGLQLGLHDLFGLDMQPLELTAAVHELLDGADVAQRWLQGKAALETARGGDSSMAANARELSGVIENKS